MPSVLLPVPHFEQSRDGTCLTVFATAPQQVMWDAFLAAWAEYDETAVIISSP